MHHDKQQKWGSAGYGCKSKTKNSDTEVPTIGKLRYLLLLVLAESLGTSGYAFTCRRPKILSLFQLLDKFCMQNIY